MKYCLLALTFLMVYQISCAQTGKPGSDIIVSTKKVYLHYQQQTDSLLFPVVSEKYPALRDSLSEKNLLRGDILDTVVARYSKCGCQTTALSYDVDFANADVISIGLYYEYYGAYPSEWEEWLTLDVHTGKPYPIENEINQAGMEYVAQLYKKQLKKAIELEKPDDSADTENKDDDQEAYDDLKANLESLTTSIIVSNYSFTDKGIWFKTDDALPHVARSHEPDRVLLITYAQLKPYIKASSLVLKNLHK
jgi:hypothetical protein